MVCPKISKTWANPSGHTSKVPSIKIILESLIKLFWKSEQKHIINFDTGGLLIKNLILNNSNLFPSVVLINSEKW